MRDTADFSLVLIDDDWFWDGDYSSSDYDIPALELAQSWCNDSSRNGDTTQTESELLALITIEEPEGTQIDFYCDPDDCNQFTKIVIRAQDFARFTK